MGEEITPCRWRGKRKKEKRESAGGRRVCVRPVVPVWCVCPGVAGWSSLLAVAVWAFVVWCSGAIKISSEVPQHRYRSLSLSLSLLSLLFFFLFFSSFLLTLSVLSTMEEEEGDSLFSLSLFLSFSLSSLIGRISPWAWASSVEINVLTHRGAHRGLQKKQREREREERREDMGGW